MIQKIFSKFILFFSLIVLYIPLSAEELWIDINLAMKNRDRIYPLLNYDQICIISPCRTGSTLVFNMFRFLFEYDVNIDCFDNGKSVVRKSHFIKQVNEKTLYLFVMRNPIDTCFSMYRVFNNNFDDIVDMYLNQMRHYSYLVEQKISIYSIKYEQFNDNLNFLFEFIEDKFNLKVLDDDKMLLKMMFSKENVLHQISNYKGFHELDTLTHFHGNHIDRGEISEEEKARVKQIFFELLIEHRKEIEGWGYT